MTTRNQQTTKQQLRREIAERRRLEQRYRALFEEAPVMYVVAERRDDLPIIADCNDLFLTTLGYGRSEVVGRPLADFYTPDSREQLLHGGYQEALEGRFTARERQLVTRDGRIVETFLRAVPEYDSTGAACGTWAMFVDVTDRKQAEEALLVKTRQLEAITRAMTAFLRTGNWREASGIFLRGALEQTASEYGFVGAVVEGPVLRILAHEGIVWDRNINREFYEQALQTYRERGYLEFTNFDNLFGRVITSGQALIANDPGTDPRSGGIPPGHPALRHFLGVPMLWGPEVVGMIGVANRVGGYTAVEQQALQVLAQMAGVLYDSYRRQQREASLEEQLRQSQKMEAIGRLAGGIAHDFNNLLTAVSGYAELLLERIQPGDANRKEVEQIKKAGDRAASLTRQLLAFSRRQVLEPKVIDLHNVVVDLEKLLRRLIGEHIELLTSLDPVLGYVKVDPGQMEQVLMNLAINAGDAMPDGGKLTIGTSNVRLEREYAFPYGEIPVGSYVLLEVTDTGCGMTEEVLSHLFEPFFTTKEVGKGTGLGLSTVYGIVRQSGGYVSVHSEPGHGSTFKIYLPRLEAPAQPLETRKTDEEALWGAETILLVEDESSVRELAASVLKNRGYAVLEAGGGPEALELCREHFGPIQLMITDVIMPHMDGRKLAEQIVSLRPEMKVLYLSTHTSDAVLPYGVSQRHSEFLQKPFRPETLLRKVREALG